MRFLGRWGKRPNRVDGVALVGQGSGTIRASKKPQDLDNGVAGGVIVRGEYTLLKTLEHNRRKYKPRNRELQRQISRKGVY